MRHLLAPFIALIIAAALPGVASADPVGMCPDRMVLVPASAVVSGDAKDKNNNGVVCAKLVKATGGPDDRSVVDDIIL